MSFSSYNAWDGNTINIWTWSKLFSGIKAFGVMQKVRHAGDDRVRTRVTDIIVHNTYN